MRPALGSPKDYRDFAAKCIRWAARAKREEHKNRMLQMASHWLQTAQEMERTGATGGRLTRSRRCKTTPGKPKSPKDDPERTGGRSASASP
jgi:hypothetical protein